MTTEQTQTPLDPSVLPLLPTHLPEVLVPQPEATKLAAATVNVTEINSHSSSSSPSDDEHEQQKKVPFDPVALKARYDAEREKRLVANPDGINQYRGIDDGDPVFGHYLHDPYLKEKITREPVDEEVEALIVGGGYGGQLVAARLIEKGIKDIRIIEKGGDFGGTWYVCFFFCLEADD